MDLRVALAWLALALPVLVLGIVVLFRLAPSVAPTGFRAGQTRWSALPKHDRLLLVFVSLVRVALVVVVLEWSLLGSLDWRPIAQVSLGLVLAWLAWMFVAGHSYD
jgi:hypothetical protein